METGKGVWRLDCSWMVEAESSVLQGVGVCSEHSSAEHLSFNSCPLEAKPSLATFGCWVFSSRCMFKSFFCHRKCEKHDASFLCLWCTTLNLRGYADWEQTMQQPLQGSLWISQQPVVIGGGSTLGKPASPNNSFIGSLECRELALLWYWSLDGLHISPSLSITAANVSCSERRGRPFPGTGKEFCCSVNSL